MTDFLFGNVKPILEIGTIGACLIMVLRLWLRGDKRYADAMEARVQALMALKKDDKANFETLKRVCA